MKRSTYPCSYPLGAHRPEGTRCSCSLGLPNELLGYVFTLCTSYDGALFLPNTQSAPYASQALALASVCSHWCSLALSTPQIWADIVILPRTATSRDRQRNVHLLEMHLDRSNNVPVTLSLPDPSMGVDQLLWGTLRAKLDPKRIIHFRFSVGPREFILEEVIHSLFMETRSGAENEEFTLHFPYLESITTRYDGVQALLERCTFPRLHTLSIFNASHVYPTDFTHTLTFPWAQITTLYFHVYSGTEVSSILKSCPLLRSLYLCVNEEAPELQSRSSCEVPFLKRLSVSVQTSGIAEAPNLTVALLGSLMCPRLEELSIRAMGLARWRTPVHCSVDDALESFLQGSGCGLKKLMIDNIPLSISIRFLARLPELRYLVLGEVITSPGQNGSAIAMRNVLNALGGLPCTGEIDCLHGGASLHSAHSHQLLPMLKGFQMVLNGSQGWCTTENTLRAFETVIRSRELSSASLIIPPNVVRRHREAQDVLGRLKASDWSADIALRVATRIGELEEVLVGSPRDSEVKNRKGVARSMYTTWFQTERSFWMEYE
ncbi:hypothetical protein Moror_5781 [Moniliophthora roreri MCA 2997]|uniref:Uncharacterized protein n=2 Tax=Moniliophthora roreri TaxID=221103 RepID=V2X494_MONRO|nr:hypothetical protein Moror_5781 [Moniliophthora roreri MCA 2997]